MYGIAFHTGVDFRDLASWNRIAKPYTIWPGQLLRLSPPGQGMASSRATMPAPPPRPSTPRAAVVPAPGNVAPVFEPSTTSTASSQSSAEVPVAGAPVTQPAPPVMPAPAAPRGASRSAGGVAWRWPAEGSLIKRFRSGDAIPGIELAGKSGDAVRAAADGVVVYSGNGLVGYGELVIVKHNDSFLSAYGHNRTRLVKEGQRVVAGQQIAEMGSTGASREELQFQIRRDGNPVDPLDYLPPR